MLINYIKKIGFLFILMFFIESCSNRNINYINYYNSINNIDSIYRVRKDTLLAIKQYKKIFRKYPPKNQESINEYETYIYLSDKYSKNFGGKKSLNKLIILVAPYGNIYKNHINLCNKYGIDSLKVRKKISEFKKKLNKQLIDSFTIAMIRDQYLRHSDLVIQNKNVEKNANLLIWTFKYYGFPSIKKIGLKGSNNKFLAMPTLISHMAESEHYPFFKEKILEYIKSGECPPRDYALMVDGYKLMNKEKTHYGNGITLQDKTDSLQIKQINCNRKNIGLPNLKDYKKK